ncbi:hypothetical protein MVLG_06934 [Microbotryum lychnidis-dioicae p1A1 Lamole]|uniref:Uncharacterized protein n=1 Tax=Microbotryum lychnidis-dioicae (strain p1A1 Lamole / MvSl-1064) TaxID=683840 RepID=U5HIT6_USTV1|nr:hypothetical protein MVLG_06934 [Microbotryum lychnidis-dioicae p1A1 Lamole]|eukprot:KDE02516.1 hypothetical protein MVLG_06934 [Microbotryum lychnidis-dioicae p1A1 Lamole]
MPQNEPDLHKARLAPPTTPSRPSPSLLLPLDRLTSSPASKRSVRSASPPIPGLASGSDSDNDDDDDDDGASSNASTTLWGRIDSGKDLDPMLTDHSDFGDEDEQCAPSGAGGLALRGGATGSSTGASTANVLAATATTTARSTTARTINHGNGIFDRPKSDSCPSVPPSTGTGISARIPIPTRHSNSLPLTSRPLDSVDHPKSSGASATAPSSLDTTVRTTASLATPSLATPVLGRLFAPSTRITSPAQSAYPLSSRDRDNSSSVFLFPPRASTSPTETSSGDAFPLPPGPTSESPTQADVHITAHELSKKLERDRESTTTSLVIDVRPVQDFLGPSGRIKGSV